MAIKNVCSGYHRIFYVVRARRLIHPLRFNRDQRGISGSPNIRISDRWATVTTSQTPVSMLPGSPEIALAPLNFATRNK